MSSRVLLPPSFHCPGSGTCYIQDLCEDNSGIPKVNRLK